MSIIKPSYVLIKTSKCGTEYIKNFLIKSNYCNKNEILIAPYELMFNYNKQNTFYLSLCHFNYDNKYLNHINFIMKKPIRFITSIRDPLDRAISHFYFDRPKNTECSFNDWYTNNYNKIYMNNSHETNLNNNHISNYLGFKSIEEINVTNIKERFYFIIMLEKINESLKKLSVMMNIEYKEYGKINKNNKEYYDKYISDEVKKLFIENNKLDYKLYNLCNQIF